MKHGNLPDADTVDSGCSLRVCDANLLLHQPHCTRPLQAWKKTAELLCKDGWKVWEAVFDPNHSFDQAAQSMYNKWSPEK